MNRRVFLGRSMAAIGAQIASTCACVAAPSRGCGLALGQGASDVPAALASCGVSKLDEICVRESARLNSLFGVGPKFAFFDDGDAPNAYAVAGEKSDPGAVLFGINLIQEMASASKNGDPLTIVAVMAHEWGHILQYKNNSTAEWSVRLELSADYLAGWYLAKTRASDPTLLSNVSELFANLGDTSFTDPDHHGTPRQRTKIMLSGAGAFRLEDGRTPDTKRSAPLPATADEALQSGFYILR